MHIPMWIKRESLRAPSFEKQRKMGETLTFLPSCACAAGESQAAGGNRKADFLCLYMPAELAQFCAKHIREDGRLQPSSIRINQEK